MSRFINRFALLLLTAGALCLPARSEVSTYATPFLSFSPGGISLDDDGNVFAADFGGFTVVRIETDGTITTVLEELDTPSGNAFDSAGNFYQSNYSDQADQPAPDTITKLDPEGMVSTFAEGLDGPVGIAIDKADTLYVAMCNADNLTRIGQDGDFEVFATSELFNCPNGITFDERGDLYVVNFSDGGVLRVTPEAEVSLFATIPGEGNGHVTYVAGDLYVVARVAHQIYKVSVETAEVELFAGTGVAGVTDGQELEAQFNGPNAIARNRQGSRLYTNGASNVVREITLDLEKPEKPKQPTAEALSKKKVRLTWKHTSLNREGFTIFLATENSDFEEIARVGPSTTGVVIRGLTPRTRYLLRVQAFNGTKVSRRSKTVRVDTK